MVHMFTRKKGQLKMDSFEMEEAVLAHIFIKECLALTITQ